MSINPAHLAARGDSPGSSPGSLGRGDGPVAVLLVEDNPGDARLVRESLRSSPRLACELDHAETLAAALDLLRERKPDLILLDLNLPDSEGLATVEAVHTAAPGAALVVLTGTDDLDLAEAAMEKGAQDYLVKGVHNGEFLERAMRFAVGRKALLAAIEERGRQLEETSAELAAILEGSPTPMVVVDEQHVVRKVNRAAARFARSSVDRMVGLKSGNALRCLIAEHAPHGCGTTENCETCPIRTATHRTLATGEGIEASPISVELQREAGTEAVDIEIWTSLVDTARGRMVILGIEDVTSRRRAERAVADSERRYRQLFERNQAGVFRSTLDGRILACNEAFARIFGLESPDHASVISARQMYHQPEDRERMLDELRRHGQLSNRETRGRTLSGRPILVLESIALVDEEGGDQVLEGTVIDITESREMEERLHQAQKMEAIGQLAGGVAHDFNNLLQALDGLVQESWTDDGQGSARPEVLDEISYLVQRGAQLTRQMLLFSRRETAKPETFDLNEVVRSSHSLLRRLLRENIELHLGLGAEAAPVHADRGQLGQVVMNLAVNAQDAMPGGGRLEVRVAAAADEVVLEVSDTGHGMPADVRDRIFEPFFTTKESGKGTGLGLSVVHGIVTGSGGALEVDSEPGAGTTFRIRLPRSAGAASETAPTTATRQSMPADVDRAGRVLLVDDEPAVREVLRRLLDRKGFDVITAGTVSEALERVDGSPLALVLTDMVLPDGNGVELIDRLRSHAPDLPAILASGYTDQDEVVREATETSSVHFLQKPFTAHDLNSALNLALAGPGKD